MPLITADRLRLVAIVIANLHLLGHPPLPSRSHHSTAAIAIIGAAASFGTTATAITSFTSLHHHLLPLLLDHPLCPNLHLQCCSWQTPPLSSHHY